MREKLDKYDIDLPVLHYGGTFPLVDWGRKYGPDLFYKDAQGTGSPSYLQPWGCWKDGQRKHRKQVEKPWWLSLGLRLDPNKAITYLAVCAVCGVDLPEIDSPGRRPRYCSPQHKRLMKTVRERRRRTGVDEDTYVGRQCRSWAHYNTPLYPKRDAAKMRRELLPKDWDKVIVFYRMPANRRVDYRVVCSGNVWTMQ